MNIDDRFDNIFKAYGGRFPADQRSSHLEYCLNSMRASIQHFQRDANIQFNIHVDYILNSTLQAAVAKDDETYFIGVYYGGIYLLCDLFMRIMSSPDILTEYGDASKEVARKLYNVQTTHWEDIYLLREHGEMNEPNDEKRILIGELLTVLCITNLIFHEMGHIFLGHKEYKETAYRNGEIISASFQQALEFEADNFALNIIVRNLINNDITLGPEKIMLLERSLIKEKLFLWHFAIYIYWRLYGNENSDLVKAKEKAHPPNRVRQYNIMGMAATIYVGILGDDGKLEEIKEILGRSALHVEHSFAAISEQPLEQHVLTSIFSPEHKSYYATVTSTLLEEVIPALRPYRHFDPESGNFKKSLLS